MAPLLNMSIDAYYHSAEMMCQLEEYLFDNFRSDEAGLSTTLRGMAEAKGSEIKYYDHNIAQLKKPALTLQEIDSAKLVDVDKDGRLPIILEGLRLVKERLGDKVPISATVTGPFSVAAMVLGTENLLKGMIKKPDKIRQLMEVIAENNNRYIQRLIDMEIGIADHIHAVLLRFFDKPKKLIANLPEYLLHEFRLFSHGLEHIPDIHEDIQDGKRSCDLKNDVFSLLTQMLAGQKHFVQSSLSKIHFLQIQQFFRLCADVRLGPGADLFVSEVYNAAHGFCLYGMAEGQFAKAGAVCFLQCKGERRHGVPMQIGIRESQVQFAGDFFADACRIGIGAFEILDISHHSTSE